MKILFLFFLLNYYYWKREIYFLQKFIGIIFNFFFLLEYFVLFILKKKYIYIFFLYKYIIKEYYINFKIKNLRPKIKLNINNYNYQNKCKKNIYINKILYLYYRRRMYLGFTIVYLQIFRRWLKETKNHIIYMYFYKWKRNYNYYKKRIIDYSLLFFFYNNYNLALYFDNWKKKINFFIFVISYIKMYSLFLLLNKIKKAWIIIKTKIFKIKTFFIFFFIKSG
jgi:hypothetical protein